MKKSALILFLAAVFSSFSPVAAIAGNMKDNLHKQQIGNLIQEFRGEEGLEIVNVGSLGTSLIKSVIKKAARAEDDPEVKEAVKLIGGLRRITIVDFEDCEGRVRQEIAGRIGRALSSSEVLMEVKDKGSTMYMYGVVDGNGDKLKDFVLYAPDDCALICLFGTISTSSVARLADM